MTPSMEAHSKSHSKALKCLPKPSWLFRFYLILQTKKFAFTSCTCRCVWRVAFPPRVRNPQFRGPAGHTGCASLRTRQDGSLSLKLRVGRCSCDSRITTSHLTQVYSGGRRTLQKSWKLLKGLGCYSFTIIL